MLPGKIHAGKWKCRGTQPVILKTTRTTVPLFAPVNAARQTFARPPLLKLLPLRRLDSITAKIPLIFKALSFPIFWFLQKPDFFPQLNMLDHAAVNSQP